MTKKYTTRKISTQEKKKYYDILVIGGGMVGASCALSLKRNEMTSALKIGVIEGSDVLSRKREPMPEIADLRVFAINHRSVKYFIELDIWDRMKQMRVAPYDQMKVWDETGGGSIHFSHSNGIHSELGFIIENHVIQTALNEGISETDVEVIAPTKISKVEVPQDENTIWNVVTTEDGTEYYARLLVGADGVNSVVRKSAQIKSSGSRYNKKAVVATIKLEHPTTTAWQKFMEYGPLAVLPLRDDYASIVWSTNISKADQLLKLDAKEFQDQLNYALRDNSKRIDLAQTFSNIPILSEGLQKVSPHSEVPVPPRVEEVVSKRLSFPLQFMHADNYVRPGVALIGDSCHVVHPLAGQGVNLGFADSKALSEVIANSVDTGSSIGDYLLLKQYEKSRKLKNISMVAGCHTLETAFSNNTIPLKLGRSIGLSIADKLPFVKGLVNRLADHRY